jgi:hypothetical protein
MTSTRALRILRANRREAVADGDTARVALIDQRIAEWMRTR